MTVDELRRQPAAPPQHPAAPVHSRRRLIGGTAIVVTLIAALLARFVLAGSGTPAPPAPGAGGAGTGAARAATTVAQTEAALRVDPDNPALLTRLGLSLLTRAR